LAHVSGFIASFFKKDMDYKVDQPWIFSAKITLKTTVGRFFGVFWLLAMAGYLLAAIGILSDFSWGTSPLFPAAILSLLTIVPFWNTVPPGAKIGAAFDILVLIVISTSLQEKLIASM
jgi:hypothetical protein